MEVKLGTPHWREGYHAAIDAEDAHREIEKIRKRDGGEVTAESLVVAAKSRRNKLHDAFEWDDTKAGHEYRLTQGRGLLGAMVIERLDAPDFPTRIYEVRRLPADESHEKPRRFYSTTEDILKDPEAREQLLKRAFAEAKSYERRYNHLEELSAIIAGIKRTLKKYSPPPGGKKLRQAGPSA